MSTKTLNTRIQAKIDTEANWGKTPNFTPLAGEICVYSDLNRIKVGDGTTKISLLKFIDEINLNNKSDINHTHNYAGSSSAGGAATSVAYGAGTADVARNVWFSDSDAVGKLVYDNDFKYNPSSNVLTVGSITGNAATATNASKVNNHTVESDVPSNAKFTDTVYTHPTTSGNKHIPSGGSSGQVLKWSADGTATWGTDNDTTYSSKSAASGGTDVSLVTTGEKYTWNNKGSYSKPSGGIPKTDLASDVQASLGKADSALQTHQSLAGYVPTSRTVNGKALTENITISAADLGLDKAMRYIGRATVNVADGSTTDPAISGYTTKTAGDVILNKDDQKEMIWNGSSWEEFGKEGSYALSNHTHDYAGSSAPGGSATSAVKLDSNAGSASQPVYFSGGKPVAVTQIDTANAQLNALSTGSSTPTDNDYYISQYVGGGTTTTTYHRRPMSALWNYIKAKVQALGYGTYSKPSDGIPKSDLAAAVQTSLNRADSAIQSHQDITGKENISNKVTTITSSSNDTQYPSAKAVYTELNKKAESSHNHDNTYLKLSGGAINPGSSGNYNEGVRINLANNGWANMQFGGAANSTSGTQDGQWLVGRRGAEGSKAGNVGDFSIEHNGSTGTGLTLHKNGDAPDWNGTKVSLETHNHDDNYLKLSGGNVTGDITINGYRVLTTFDVYRGEVE